MGVAALLTDAASIDRKLVEQLLNEQRREADSGGNYISKTMAGLITSRSPEWLLSTGTGLLSSDDPAERPAGSRLIRELTSPHSDVAIAAILEQLGRESDEVVIAFLIGALSFLHAASALPVVLSYASHPYRDVRDAVADAITGCSNGTLTAESMDVLFHLAVDDDPNVRFSAVFELGAWWSEGEMGAPIERALRLASSDQVALVSRTASAALDRIRHARQHPENS